MTITDHPTPVPRSRPTRGTARRCLTGLALLALAAAVLSAVTMPAYATGGPGRIATLQRALDDVVAAGAPGAAALVRTGERTIRLSSGNGNLAPVTPMRVGDRTRIGGMTKSYTATVVLQLVGEGVLRLDDNVERWLPAAIPNGDAISVRQLLNHTSGLYDYGQDPTVLAPYEGGDLTHVFDPRQGIQVAVDHGPLFPPGEGFAYSNTNYLLLGMIVEAATGTPLDAHLRTRIFGPLGLTQTSYPLTSDIVGEHTHGYLMLDPQTPFDVTAFSPSLFGAAGAILSNADDVAHFYRALLTGRLLTPGLLRAMRTVDPVATGGTPDAGILGGGWGLGLLRESFPCGTAWGHDAENPGYMTAAWSSRNGARQVVVVVNSNYGHDDPVSAAMRRVLALAYCGGERG